MIYLVNAIQKFNGECRPISYQYRDEQNECKSPTNITITNHNGQIIANTRLTDYMYLPIQSPNNIQYISVREDYVNMTSINSIQPLFTPCMPNIYSMKGTNRLTLNNNSSVAYSGLEDVRLVEWNGVLYGIGFRPDVIAGKVTPQLIEYDDDLSIKRTWFMNTNKAMEKNWQPVVDKPFTFMYDPDTSSMVVLDLDNMHESNDTNNPSDINNIDTPDFTGAISGSSQLIRLHDGNYLSICHTSHRYMGFDGMPRWFYNHYFVLYDENMNKIWVSQPFHFVENCMEFCCGICELDGNIHISFSVMDGTSNIITIPYDSLMEVINIMKNDPGQLDCEPAYDYLVQNYESGSIVGTDRILYAFMLEQKGLFNHLDDIPDILGSVNVPKHVKINLYAYFAVRKQNGAKLIKNIIERP